LQGELEHRLVKKFYAKMNKNNAMPQITKHTRREAIIWSIAAKDPSNPKDHGQLRLETNRTPLMSPEDHHCVADLEHSHYDILGWVHKNADNPGVKVRHPSDYNHTPGLTTIRASYHD
jgi:hypothetical protein